MIQTDELRGIITKRNMSQASVAKAIGITPKTFYGKMKKGIFGSDEIDKMISLLKIQNPAEIFLRVSNSKRYRVVVKSERRGGNVSTIRCTRVYRFKLYYVSDFKKIAVIREFEAVSDRR